MMAISRLPNVNLFQIVQFMELRSVIVFLSTNKLFSELKHNPQLWKNVTIHVEEVENYGLMKYKDLFVHLTVLENTTFNVQTIQKLIKTNLPRLESLSVATIDLFVRDGFDVHYNSHLHNIDIRWPKIKRIKIGLFDLNTPYAEMSMTKTEMRVNITFPRFMSLLSLDLRCLGLESQYEEDGEMSVTYDAIQSILHRYPNLIELKMREDPIHLVSSCNLPFNSLEVLYVGCCEKVDCWNFLMRKFPNLKTLAIVGPSDYEYQTVDMKPFNIEWLVKKMIFEQSSWETLHESSEINFHSLEHLSVDMFHYDCIRDSKIKSYAVKSLARVIQANPLLHTIHLRFGMYFVVDVELGCQFQELVDSICASKHLQQVKIFHDYMSEVLTPLDMINLSSYIVSLSSTLAEETVLQFLPLSKWRVD